MKIFPYTLALGLTALTLPGCAMADDDDYRWRAAPSFEAEVLRGMTGWGNHPLYRVHRDDYGHWSRHRGWDDDDRRGGPRWRDRDDDDDDDDDGDDD